MIQRIEALYYKGFKYINPESGTGNLGMGSATPSGN